MRQLIVHPDGVVAALAARTCHRGWTNVQNAVDFAGLSVLSMDEAQVHLAGFIKVYFDGCINLDGFMQRNYLRKRVQKIRWYTICVPDGLLYGKSARVLFGIDLVQNVQLLRRGIHILGDDVEDAAHTMEVVIRAGVNGLVFRVMGMQAVRLIFLDKALARDDENADLARLNLLREFHQQFVAVLECGYHAVAGNGDDRICPADAAGIAQKNVLVLIGVGQWRAGTG